MKMKNAIDKEKDMQPGNPVVDPAPAEAASTPAAETIEEKAARLEAENAELKATIADKEEFDRKLIAAGERDPELFDVIEAVYKGMPFATAVKRYVDMDSISPEEGAPDWEGYQKASEEYEADKAKRAKMEEKRRDNQQKSVEEFAAMMEELGAPEDKVDQFATWWEEYNQDLSDGKLSRKRWKSLWTQCFHDEMIAQKDAEAEQMAKDAEIAGRNAQIEQKRAKKETGDGIPRMSNTGSVKDTNKKKSFGASFLDGVV